MRKTLALIFSFFGLFDSAYLWWVYTSPTHPMVCLGSGCDEVRASQYAFWGGIPTPAFGAVMYAALVVLLLLEPFLPSRSLLLRRIAFYLSAVGLIASLYLTSLEAFQIHAWCAWCVAQQIAIAIIFVLLGLELSRPATEDRKRAQRNIAAFVTCLVIAVPAFAWLSHHSAAEVKKQLDAGTTDGPIDLSKLIRPDSHVIGPADAPVTIVEFGDFQCPSCVIAEAVNRQIRQEYPTKVRFVFREFPLAKFHIFAQRAAEAAECAADQGKFWEMHDRMYAAYGELAPVQLKFYAQDIGLDTARFNACLDGGQKEQRVQEDVDDGKALVVNATPTFWVNQQKHVGGLKIADIAALTAGGPVQTTQAAPTAPEPKPVEPPKKPEAIVKAAPSTKEAPKPAEAKPQPATTATAATSIVPGLAPAGANPLALGSNGAGDCDENAPKGPQKNEIPTTAARDLHKKGALFVDIRAPKDFAKSHIPGAVNLPLNKISDGAETLPKDKPVVVYESGLSAGDVCAASRAAAGLLASRGFKDVKVYHDGFAGWQKSGAAVQ